MFNVRIHSYTFEPDSIQAILFKTFPEEVDYIHSITYELFWEDFNAPALQGAQLKIIDIAP